jgi:hypothetical protein
MMDDQKILDNAPEIKNNAGALLYYSPESDRYYEEHDGYWYEVDDYTMTKIIAPTAFIRSLADIKELVELRNANAELMKGYEELRITALHAVCKIGGGQAKADLRDAYDKATEQLEKLKAGS